MTLPSGHLKAKANYVVGWKKIDGAWKITHETFVPESQPIPNPTLLQTPARATQGSTALRQEVIDVEHRWTAAELKGDAAGVERVLADEFVNTNEDGILQDKSQTISGIRSGNVKVASETMDDIKVRVNGDVAVVTLHIVQTGTSSNKDISGSIRVTDVFVHRDGRWQCVAEQATRITKQ